MSAEFVIYGEKRTPDGWDLAEPWVERSDQDGPDTYSEKYWMPGGGDKVPRPVCWGSRGLLRILTGFMAGPESAPIAPSRGLPEDLSPSLNAFFEEEEFFDGEPPPTAWSGWLLIPELTAFDWESEPPHGESERVAGVLASFGILSPDQVAEHVYRYVEGVAGRSWRELAGPAFFEGISRLRSHGADEDLRIVFTSEY